MQRGLVQVYTGNGKGKTTAALGLALRASGAGLRVYIGQFIKRGDYSEIIMLRRLGPSIVVRQYGAGCYVKKPSPADCRRAHRGLELLARAMHSGKYDIVIADEINCAIKAGLLANRDVLDFAAGKPAGVELVLTGRDAPCALLRKADLVTEMRKIKHPFDRGMGARRGIEY